MKFRTILLFILTLSTGAYAQKGDGRRIEEDRSGFVTNEDRGKAYIVTTSTQTTSLTARRTNAPVPRQFTIFLGSEWSSDKLRRQESALANLLANTPDTSGLDDLGIKKDFTLNESRENLLDLGKKRSISDLEIQTVIERMLSDGTLPRPTETTIYVVYLDPTIQSTLAGMSAGKHYLAYFNNFNPAGIKIRYVVVPMNVNSQEPSQAALKGFLSAILN